MNSKKLNSPILTRTSFKFLILPALASGIGFVLPFIAPNNAFAQTSPPFGPSPNVNTNVKNIFYFTPWGSQVDEDKTQSIYHVPNTQWDTVKNENIFDIEKGPNEILNFDVYLYRNTPIYRNPDELFFNLTLNLEYDSTEWIPTNILDPRQSFVPANDFIWTASASFPMPVWTLTRPPAKPLTLKQTLDNSYSGAYKLGTILGITKVPGIARHDGVSDVKISLTAFSPYDMAKFQNALTQIQDVEVQTPAPLPILGAGVAFGSIRKLRRFTAALKNNGADVIV